MCEGDYTCEGSEDAKVIVKNLERSIDTRALYQIFVTFGKIVSCRVALDANGNSKGYGIIQFEKPDVANMCVVNVNNLMLNSKKLYVAKLKPGEELS